MAFAPTTTYIQPYGDGSIRGRFVAHKPRAMYEYSENRTGMFPDFPYLVWVTQPIPGIDQGYRFARVLKTRAHVLIDEGNVETWVFSSHKEYDHE